MTETIDECIKLFEKDIRCCKMVLENEKFFAKVYGGTEDKFNDTTIQELNDDILRYQKHLSNLYKIREEL